MVTLTRTRTRTRLGVKKSQTTVDRHTYPGHPLLLNSKAFDARQLRFDEQSDVSVIRDFIDSVHMSAEDMLIAAEGIDDVSLRTRMGFLSSHR
jgi:hypothetical protein